MLAIWLVKTVKSGFLFSFVNMLEAHKMIVWTEHTPTLKAVLKTLNGSHISLFHISLFIHGFLFEFMVVCLL